MNEAGDYSVSVIDGFKSNCPNSSCCPRGNMQHHCLFPPLKETLSGSFTTRGLLKLNPRVMGKFFAMNQSYFQYWGVTFFIRETSGSITVYPWMDSKKKKLHAHSNMHYKLTFYGKKSYQVRIRGIAGGQIVTIPKENILITPRSGCSTARYKLRMKTTSS